MKKILLLMTFAVFLNGGHCQHWGEFMQEELTAKEDYFWDSGIIETQVDEAAVSGIISHTVFYIDVPCYNFPCYGFSVRKLRQGGQSIYDVSDIKGVYFDPSKDNKIDNSNPNHWYLYYQESWWMWDVTALDID